MKKDGERQTGLYIHIPFCVRKCLYCDFLSAPAGEQQARYVEALCREIALESRCYAPYRVRTIFMGGGTPSLLAGEWTERILETVRSHYNVDGACEISMEVNPGTLTQEKLAAWKRAGINRLSIGLQSAVEGELKALGRIHSLADFLESYDRAVRAGFENINVDLMSAIPGQSLESWRETLERVLSLRPRPGHISAYSLIIEEGTPFWENRPQLPDEETDRQMYQITNDILSAAGYGRYEISNYALPGRECRHNITYWRRGNYVGFGVGAASLVEDARFRNTSDRKAYEAFFLEGAGREDAVAGGSGRFGLAEQIREEKQVLSKEEQMEEFMFLGLRMREGVCAEEFRRIFGVSIHQVYPGIVEEFCRRGLLMRRTEEAPCRALDQGGKEHRTGVSLTAVEPGTGSEGAREWICLTDYGVDVSNRVMAKFLLT